MNRRSLIKYLVALPVCKIVNVFAASRPTKDVVKTKYKMLPKLTFYSTVRVRTYYDIAEDGTIGNKSHTEYKVTRDCGHDEWIQSPSISDPAGQLEDMTRHNIYDPLPRWPGKCQDCMKPSPESELIKIDHKPANLIELQKSRECYQETFHPFPLPIYNLHPTDHLWLLNNHPGPLTVETKICGVSLSGKPYQLSVLNAVQYFITTDTEQVVEW